MAELIFMIFVFISGLTLGIPIGLVLDDLFHKWSVNIVSWVYRKIGWDGGEEDNDGLQ